MDPGAADEEDLPAAFDAGDESVDEIEGEGEAFSVAGPGLGVEERDGLVKRLAGDEPWALGSS